MSKPGTGKKGRRGGDPTSLSDLVRNVYPGKKSEDLESLHAFRWWFRAVPPRVYERALPVRLRGGVLTVHAANSTWASELSFLGGQLLSSVQKHAPHARVNELRFRVGPLPALRRPNHTRERHGVDALPLSALPPALARALAGIRDDELREQVQRAASFALAQGADHRNET